MVHFGEILAGDVEEVGDVVETGGDDDVAGFVS
jgi:hypothetical protein